MKPNYQFEKRQREMEKKKKKAEKALKRESTPDAAPAEDGEASTGQAEATPTPKSE